MKITIVGRPNVGKSALFNRILGKRIAIVDEVSGITRDRLEQRVEWEGHSFMLVDTGGYIPRDKDTIIEKVKEQAMKAITDSSVLVFVIDVQEGITPLDLEVADVLRKSGKKIILVGNKADNERYRQEGQVLYEMGFSDVILVSAIHGMGIEDILDIIIRDLDECVQSPEKEIDYIKLAVVGRPNVGKSTFINTVLAEERLIVDDFPGTTRDSVDVHARIIDQDWLFIDTAGIRKKKKITEAVEKYSLIRTQESIKRADIVLFMVDALEGLAKQDEQAIKFANDNGKSCVVVVNKWDIVSGIPKKEYEWNLKNDYDVMTYIPVNFISALRGDNVNELLKFVLQINHSRNKTLKTNDLNNVLKNAFEKHPPPIRKKKRLKFYYVTQIGTAPPRILCFVNNPVHSDRSYENYLINILRKKYNFIGTPIKLFFKGKEVRKRK